MNAQTTAQMSLPHIANDDDVAKIKKAMRAYSYYKTPEELVTALNKARTDTENFLGLPVFAQGIEQDEKTGEFVLVDADKYADSTAVLAYVGGQSKDAAGKNAPVIKSILAFGIPTVDVALAKAPDLVGKVLGKEFRHVYFRNFRDATTPAQAEAGFAAAPIGIEAFAASHARGAAEELDTDTFDAIWPGLRKKLLADMPALAGSLPSKAEIIKAIRSKSYAEGVHPDLEKRNLFARIAVAVVHVAAQQSEPLDASAVKSWFADRETTHIDYPKLTSEALDSIPAFDMSAAAAMLAPAPATQEQPST